VRELSMGKDGFELLALALCLILLICCG